MLQKFTEALEQGGITAANLDSSQPLTLAAPSTRSADNKVRTVGAKERLVAFLKAMQDTMHTQSSGSDASAG